MESSIASGSANFLSGGPSYDKLNGGPDADTAKAPGPDFLVSIEFIVP